MIWTRLTGLYIKKQLVVRLRFGRPAYIRWLDGGVTHYWFRPGQIFSVVWWARLSPRKQVASFAVAEALRAGEHGHLLPGVRPAVRVHVFLNTRCVGKDRRVVDRAETLIRRIERDGIEPCDLPNAYYRAAGQSLRVGREPRRLDRDDLRRFLRSQVHAK